MITRKRWAALAGVVSKINHSTLLKGINVTLGSVAAATGMLLLLNPEYFNRAAAFSFLSGNTVPWGMLFFALGIVVICSTVLRVEASIVPCCAMAALFSVYGLLSLGNFFAGQAGGITAAWALAMAIMSIIGAVAGAVPKIEAYAESQVVRS